MSNVPAAPVEWTIARLLAWTADHLDRRGIAEGRLASEVLLSRALECPRIQLYTRMNDCPPPARLDAFRESVKRAAAGEPIAYVVGEKEFFSLTFRVTSDVLIPRPETETLVERVIDHCQALGLENAAIWDLCTGSGCVAVSVLKHVPSARVVASDISEPALAVARANAERHQVADRFSGICADGLALPREAVPESGFDVLVCNPPYIPSGSVAGLDKGIRDYEPRIALTDEADGLCFYRVLAAGAQARLSANGVVMVEVADDRAAAVVEIFTARPEWVHRQSVRDRVTGRERVVVVSRA